MMGEGNPIKAEIAPLDVNRESFQEEAPAKMDLLTGAPNQRMIAG
jgi:hypothetical protein